MNPFGHPMPPRRGHALARLLMLPLLALLVSGCATLGGGAGGSGGTGGDSKVFIGDISNLPQVLLPGASLDNARSVAMAAARTKGWDVVSADANRLLLERPLPAGSPQAMALDSALTTPRMQVETDLVERSDGTIVALRAYALTNPGTEQSKRVDYTKDYEGQLLISLSSLSSAWLAARDKVNSEVPALAQAPSLDDATDTAGGEIGDAANTVATAGAATATAEVGTVVATEAETAPAPAPSSSAPVAATEALRSPPAAEPAAASVSGSSAGPAPVTRSSLVAPTIEAPASPTTAEAAAAGPMRSETMSAPALSTAQEVNAGSNDMLVLNQSSGGGLWGPYAEDYARLRGCKVGPNGASLLRQVDGGEVLEVECTGAANVLVNCRGGVCTPLR